MSYQIDAVPCGVRITTRDESGEDSFQFLTYEDAISRLDSGEYDDSVAGDDGFPGIGSEIHCAVAKGGACGYFDLTPQISITMWRWLIASAFITEMKCENGTHLVTNRDGSYSWAALYSNGEISIPVYPSTERLAMAKDIEWAIIERHGMEQGTEKTIALYRAMLDVQEGVLTPFGRETLANLHNGFINDLQTNGWPKTPVAH